MSDIPICGESTKNGSPCGQKLPGSKECPWHGPSSTPESRSQLARLGGLGKLRVLPETTPKPELRTPQGLRHELRELIHAVKTGTLGPEPARVAILGLGVAVKISELELHGMISDLEERLAERQGRRLA